MLIFDDTNARDKPEIILKPDIEACIVPKVPQVSINNEDLTRDSEDLQNLSSSDRADKVSELVLTTLWNEIKESLFPARVHPKQTDDHWPVANPPKNVQFSRKLAFEGEVTTSFPHIDMYLKEVIDEIIKNESMFINNILTPIQRDSIEMLHLIRTSDIGNYSHFDTYDYVIPILGVQIYLEIEKEKERN